MMMTSQADMWSGPVGDSWVRNAPAYDRMLAPLGRAALDLLELDARQRVLDVGCGTGATTFEIGRAVPEGSVLGVDASRPMIAHARARSAQGPSVRNVEFQVVDVETHELPGPFDAAFSRFGVMFFGAPTVAFANLAAALRVGGRLAFVCFQAPSTNPFIMVPTGAALARLGDVAMPPPGSAGPFSLADPTLLRDLLESSGFKAVTVTSGPSEVTLGAADDLPGLAKQCLEQNPLVLSQLLKNPSAAPAAIEAAAQALAQHVHDGSVRLGAGTWLVHARRV